MNNLNQVKGLHLTFLASFFFFIFEFDKQPSDVVGVFLVVIVFLKNHKSTFSVVTSNLKRRVSNLYNNFSRAHMSSHQELATILLGMKSPLDPQTLIIIGNWKTLRNVFSETRVLSPKWDINIKPLPSGLGDLQGRGGREIVRATHSG